MKYGCIIFCLLAFNTFAESNKSPEIESFRVVSNEIDENLEEGQSKFTFRISNHHSDLVEIIYYSINDMEKAVKTAKEMEIVEDVIPGEFDFKFLLNIRHREVIVNNVKIEPQHHMVVQLNFKSTEQNIMVRKPVIYLYPEEETQIDIQLSTVGELLFSYPAYNNGWSVTAGPEGTITFEEEAFNYLFWESEQTIDPSIIDPKQGAYVHQNDLLSFLERTLITYGFNSKERADFITYWVPNMKDATNLYIYFLFDEACDKFATLNIRPEPAQTARFYMLWADAGTDYDEFGIIPQEIPSFSRDGFTVLEWGGAEIDVKSKTIN